MPQALCDYTPELRLYYDRSKEDPTSFWQAVRLMVLKSKDTRDPFLEVQATLLCEGFSVTPVTWPGYQLLHIEMKHASAPTVVDFVRRSYCSSPPTQKTWALVTQGLGARLFFCSPEDWVSQDTSVEFVDAGDISSFTLLQGLRAIVEEVAAPRLDDVVVLFRCTMIQSNFDIHNVNARHLIALPTGVAKWSSTHSAGGDLDQAIQYGDSATPRTFALTFSRNRHCTRNSWVFGSSSDLEECDVQLDFDRVRAVSACLFAVSLRRTGTPYIRALASQPLAYRCVPTQSVDDDRDSSQGSLWSGLPQHARIDITGRLYVKRGPVRIMFWCPVRSFEDALPYSKNVNAFRASTVRIDATKDPVDNFRLQLEPDGTVTPLLRFSRKTGASYKTVDHIRRTGAKGSTASVGCVLETGCHMTFALKTPYPTPDVTLRHQRNESLLSEYQALMRLKHPNIVNVHDFLDPPDPSVMASMVLEWFDEVLDPHMFPILELPSLLSQICEVLDFLQRHNIVHRDIKPKNFLTRRSSDVLIVKLSDFGSCQSIHGDYLDSVEGMTPVYRAPETCRTPVMYDHAVDLWALGVILTQCVMAYMPAEDQFWVAWNEKWPGFAPDPAELLRWTQTFVQAVRSRCISFYKPLLVGLLHEDQVLRWSPSRSLDWLNARRAGGGVPEMSRPQNIVSTEHARLLVASREDAISSPPSRIDVSLPDTQCVTETLPSTNRNASPWSTPRPDDQGEFMASTEVLCVGDQKVPLQHGGTTFDAFQLLAMSCMSASSKLEAQYYLRGIVHIAPKHETEDQSTLHVPLTYAQLLGRALGLTVALRNLDGDDVGESPADALWIELGTGRVLIETSTSEVNVTHILNALKDTLTSQQRKKHLQSLPNRRVVRHRRGYQGTWASIDTAIDLCNELQLRDVVTQLQEASLFIHMANVFKSKRVSDVAVEEDSGSTGDEWLFVEDFLKERASTCALYNSAT